MRFRIFCYFHMGVNLVRMTSESIDTEEAANAMLEKMVELGATGGDIETHVGGIGWVLGGTTEAESAMISRRREEHIEVCDEFREIVGRPRSDDPRIVL